MRLGCFVLLSIAACSFDSSGNTPDIGSAGVVHRTLTFDNSRRDRVDNFPALVVLDSTRIHYELVADPEVDLEFLDDGNPAPYEIERWDPAGKSFVWVLVRRLDEFSATDTIVMAYGPDVQSDGPDAGAVWSRYEAVWHFDELGTGGESQLENSVANNHPGLPIGTARDSAGIAAGAQRFSSTADSFVTLAGGDLFDGWNRFTIEWWIFPDYGSASELDGEPRVFQKANVLVNGRLLDASPMMDAQTDIRFSGSTEFARLLAIQPRDWNYLAYTFDDRNFRKYRNGTEIGSSERPGESLPESMDELVLGRPSGNAFNGLIDELRIADVGVTGTYLDAQNQSVRDQLITYGAAVPQ